MLYEGGKEMLEKNLKVYWKGFDVGKCRCTSDLDEFYLEFQTNSVKKNIIYSTIENSTFISFYSNQNGIIKQSEMTIEKNKISFSGSNEAIIYKGNLIPYESKRKIASTCSKSSDVR